jgi:hypothetical protein
MIQELYATSSKFDKLKISKAIVAAVRRFGGRFLQAEGDGPHFDIGDKRAWDKTSQALREGQTEIRARLAAEEEKASGAQKVAEYQQVITEQTFLAYACKILQSLYDPDSGSSTSCGPNCPHAKRRATMNRTDAMALQHAMHMQHQQQQQGDMFINQQLLQNQQYYMQNPNPYGQPTQNYANYDVDDFNYAPNPTYVGMSAANTNHEPVPPLPQMGVHPVEESLNSLEPLPYNMPYIMPQVVPQPQCTGPSNLEEDPQTWESPHAKPNNWDTLFSIDSPNTYGTETLRKMLCDDVDMDSDEMSRQLSEMIRRKSHGLIRIEAVEAFEDLVFEEDSAGRVKFEFPEPQVSNAPNRSFSGLTDRGESLMNMSLLTIEDRDGGPILRADASTASGTTEKRFSKVSFAPENVSTMSLDVGSIRDFDVDIDDSADSPLQDTQKTSAATAESPSSPLSRSRAMGFPIRKTILNQQQAGVPTVIPVAKNDGSNNTRGRISTLTFSEASALQHDIEFSEMAKNVAPPTSEFSLKVDNMSFSNMSLMSVVDESILGDDKKGVNQV